MAHQSFHCHFSSPRTLQELCNKSQCELMEERRIILAKTKQDLHMLSHPRVFVILFHPWITIYFSLLVWVFDGSKPVIF